jgi:flagellar hook-length control protein FliK
MINATAAVQSSSHPTLAVKEDAVKGEQGNFIATLKEALKRPEAGGNPVSTEELKHLLKDLLRQLRQLLEGMKNSANQNTPAFDKANSDPFQNIDLGQMAEQLEHVLFSISEAPKPSSPNKLGIAEMSASMQQQIKPMLALLQDRKNIASPGSNLQDVTGKLKSFSESIERLLTAVSKNDSAKFIVKPELSKQMHIVKHHSEPESVKLSTAAKPLETAKSSLIDNTLRMKMNEVQPVNKQMQQFVPASFESGPMSKVQQFVLHLEKGGEPQPQQQFVREFAQILSKARFSVNGNGQQQLTIKLYPEHLGTLDVRLTHAKGQLTATILAQTAAAKELVDTHLHQLRGAFTSQNLQVDKLEVMLPFTGQQSQKSDDGLNDEPGGQQENLQQQDEEESSATSFLEWLETHLT